MIKTFDFDFLQKTIHQIEAFNLRNCVLGFAVSGGEDSMVLLHHFLKIQKKLRSQSQEKIDLVFKVLHVHHGISKDSATNEFRERSKNFVMEFCKNNNLDFETNDVVPNDDSSEESLRNIRIHFFNEQLNKDGKSEKNSVDVIVTAHHRMDLLETRLIRLLRGSGPQGLEAMKDFDGTYFRPLLTWDKSFIQNYVQQEKIRFIEDPSNQETRYFRNWIRNQLLPQIQDHRPGAVEALARSLEQIVESLNSPDLRTESIISSAGIDRKKLIYLSKAEQRGVVASYLKMLEIKAYSHNHIDEILKRLDSSQKELTFTVLGLTWNATASCVAATPSDV